MLGSFSFSPNTHDHLCFPKYLNSGLYSIRRQTNQTILSICNLDHVFGHKTEVFVITK